MVFTLGRLAVENEKFLFAVTWWELIAWFLP